MKKADLGKRLVAYIIDSFVLSTLMNIIIIPFYCVMFVLMPTSSTRMSTYSSYSSYSNSGVMGGGVGILIICCLSLLLILGSIGISYAYYIWFPVKKWNGATLGKKAMNLKVVRSNGAAVTQVDMFVREFIGKFVSGIVMYLGFIWILIDEKGQGWHDKIADTWVVTTEE